MRSGEVSIHVERIDSVIKTVGMVGCWGDGGGVGVDGDVKGVVPLPSLLPIQG